jgi:hypothetical protein
MGKRSGKPCWQSLIKPKPEEEANPRLWAPFAVVGEPAEAAVRTLKGYACRKPGSFDRLTKPFNVTAMIALVLR